MDKDFERIEKFIEDKIKNGERINITPNSNGEIKMSLQNKVTYIEVPRDRYDEIIEKAEEVKIQKEKEDRKNMNDIFKPIEEIFSHKRAPKAPIGLKRVIDNANTKGIEDYKKSVTAKDKNKSEKNQGRIIKGFKKFLGKHKFKIVSLLLAGGIAVGAAQIPSWKSNVAKEALHTIKTEISESSNLPTGYKLTVMDYSSRINLKGDYNRVNEITVVDPTGKSVNNHRYEAFISGASGETRVNIDTIKNKDIKEAISIISKAQDGSVFDTIRAKELIEDIENGEKDLRLEGIDKEYNSEKNQDEEIDR